MPQSNNHVKDADTFLYQPRPSAENINGGTAGPEGQMKFFHHRHLARCTGTWQGDTSGQNCSGGSFHVGEMDSGSMSLFLAFLLG